MLISRARACAADLPVTTCRLEAKLSMHRHFTCAGAFPAPPASPIRELESSKIVFPHLQRLQRSSCPPEHHKAGNHRPVAHASYPKQQHLPSLLEKHPIPEHLPLLYSQN